jgi:hypothetical protein
VPYTHTCGNNSPGCVYDCWLQTQAWSSVRSVEVVTRSLRLPSINEQSLTGDPTTTQVGSWVSLRTSYGQEHFWGYMHRVVSTSDVDVRSQLRSRFVSKSQQQITHELLTCLYSPVVPEFSGTVWSMNFTPSSKRDNDCCRIIFPS